MIDQKFTLRAMQPSDSPGLTKLITDFAGDLTTHFQVDPYAAICFGTEFRTIGVVVEHDDFDGFVGMGTVRFGRAQFNGEVLPFAILDGLKVHEDFRGQGLGYQIANWRIQQARAAYGDQCVIATGMLHDNHASHAVAAKWCREFAESAINVIFMPTRVQQPKPLAGMAVHEIEPQEYEEFAVKQNTFHRNYNLYPPGDVNTIANALAISVEGRQPYRFFAVADQRGNLMAGAQTWARGVLKSDTVNNPPAPLRLMNRVLHVLPADFILRDIFVSGIWYEPGQINAATFLWEAIRWECKGQGTSVTASFDTRDPAQEIVSLKPWHQPRPQITLAIHGPAPIDPVKLFFGVGRV